MRSRLWSWQELKNAFDQLDCPPTTTNTCEVPLSSSPVPQLFKASNFDLCFFRMDQDLAMQSSATQNIAGPPISLHFQVERQKRPGTKHGLGGRPHAPSAAKLQKLIPAQIGSALSRRLFELCLSNLTLLISEVCDIVASTSTKHPPALAPSSSAEFCRLWKSMMNEKQSTACEIVPGPYLCICFKVPLSRNIDYRTEFAMDRHASCTWLSSSGEIKCTCVGSTQFRISQSSSSSSDISRCPHVLGFLLVLETLSSSLTLPVTDIGRALFHMYILRQNICIADFPAALPEVHTLHKRSIVVVVLSEQVSGSTTIMFIPIRHVQKGFSRLICAYCDTILNSSCHHTRLVEAQQLWGDHVSIVETDTTFEEPVHSLSKEPLAPVNCKTSMARDRDICSLARSGEAFFVSAPTHCALCQSPRDQASRKLWTNGIVTCSIGPCKMVLEEFQCSSASCRRSVIAEGRSHYMVLENRSNAGTHAFLRREIYGVVSSNGSLTGRLKHFHSYVTANILFGLLPENSQIRSVKTLMKLCSLMLKLMCMRPPRSLFHCSVCESLSSSPAESPRSLCMDGISQGYLSSKQRAFENISEPCKSLSRPSGFASGRTVRQYRPMTGLVRETRPITILLSAIRGKELKSWKISENDFVSAIRMISGSVLPDALSASRSVCGVTRGDILNDIGEHCTLVHIQNLVSSLFDVKELLKRLVGHVDAHMKESPIRIHLVESIRGLNTRPTAQCPAEKICWAPVLSSSNDPHMLHEIFALFRMLLQGPVTQFVRRSDALSLSKLADICIASDRSAVQNLLRQPHTLIDTADANCTNILLSLKVLRAGLFSLTQITGSDSTLSSGPLELIGFVLKDCVALLRAFYKFYDASNRNESAFTYRDRWSSGDQIVLKSLMRKRYGDAIMEEERRDLIRSACRTGSYFPDREQVRPLPFNDEEGGAAEPKEFIPCSKDFAQRQNVFTPGALTFCCSCSHPKILGFKVLQKHEGPRAILDVILSRFPVLPRHLIYDFCCGLFLSAIHSLWWAIANSYIVCDNFHVKNHTCSPTYNPKAHDMLDSTNTVAHEQRNRAIEKLGLSLRNCKRNLYIALLAYQTVMLNLRATAKDTKLYEGREMGYFDFDVEWAYFNCLQLSCYCCVDN